MFFELFKINPKIPKYWNVCHLWVAQCIISSIIAAKRKYYQKEKEKNIFIKNIIKDAKIFIDQPENQYFFNNEEFKKLIIEGIYEYLLTEINYMILYVKKNIPLPLKHRKDALIDSFNHYPYFHEFINHINKLLKDKKNHK